MIARTPESAAAMIPSGNGKIATVGFCWGGGTSFRYALHQTALNAAVSYYGPMPADLDYSNAKAPILGLYGGNDNRVNATIPKSTELMKNAGKTYEPETYEGAGHGFMRSGDDPKANKGNKKGRDEAWARWKELLKKI